MELGGKNLGAVSFPVGGIGAGCIGVDGSGDLAEWEVFNRPAKGRRNGMSHFAVRAEREGSGGRSGEVVDARILHGGFPGCLSGSGDGFGFGPDPDSLCGLPHFRSVSLRGEFPVGEWTFRDARFPGEARLVAWSPFVPGRSDVSSLPCAVFEIAIRNRARWPLVFSAVGCLASPWRGDRAATRSFRRAGRAALVHSSGDAANPGELALSLDAPGADISRQTFLYRGAWCDRREVYWHDLRSPGPFRDRRFAGPSDSPDAGLLAARFRLAPGESRTVRFVVSWFVPWRTNDWTPPARLAEWMKDSGVAENRWRNYYAEALCTGAADAAARLLRCVGQTRSQVFAFRDALHRHTSIPAPCLEGAAKTLSVLVSPAVLRLPDSALWGWEGVAPSRGSCEGTCQHVWNYEQATALLFPDLARSMREQQFRFCFDPGDGGLLFRQQLPPGVRARRTPWFRPCVDGTMGEVPKTFREWRVSGDGEWLRSVWPFAKKALAYAWSPQNPDRWDPEKSGVLSGRQHHTLDMELFGPTAWLEGLYLAALRAASKMARAVGDDAFAAECEAVFARGRAWTEAHLFDGSYYSGEPVGSPAISPGDPSSSRSVLRPGDPPSPLSVLRPGDPPPPLSVLRPGDSPFPLSVLRRFGNEAVDRYWDAEHREVKYQIGGGLSIDAHLGPLWAALYGAADDLLDPARVDATLRAILRHNFKPSMREAANTWRVFAADDEAGTVMVSWPKGRRKPVIPIPYHSECMTGFEWAFATHLAWRGRVREAEKVAAAVRARYDGAKRNPWNEIECGSNYVRAMAAYGLVQAFSGFRYDMTRGEIGFAPRIAGAFSSFWSVGRAWGVYSRTAAGRERIEVLFGSLPLRRLALSNTSPLPSQSDNIPRICVSVISPHPTVSGIILHPSVSSTSPRPSVSERSLRLASRTVSARREADTLVFSRSLLLRAGDILQLRPF